VFISFNLIFIKAIPFVIRHEMVGYKWLSSWYQQGWLGYVFISNLIASSLTFILLLPEIKKLKLQFDFVMFKTMMLYSWPILVANISYIINENIDKMMLPKLLPVNLLRQGDVGIYAAGCKIALFLSIFINAFRLGAEPFFFNHAKNKNAGETYARIMDYFVIAVVMIFVAIIANIEILKYFIHGKDAVETNLYWSGLRVVPLLLFGYVSLGIYMNLSVWYKLSDQTKYGLYISGIGAVLTIALNWIFIPKYSYMASAWISLVAYATMMVLSYVWGQKNYPIPYNLKKNLAYIIASIVLVYLSFTVFKRNIFAGNALLILFILTAVYFEGKDLKVMFIKR
jgi:O-antigen/teichoic acid export membrane protein